MREHLLAWQWSDYPAKHQSRANLLLHIVAVPVFELGTLVVLYGAARRSPLAVLIGAVAAAISIAVQGRGHRLEPETPAAFDGPLDFVSRLLAEQWVTFPRFVLSGRWYHNLRRAS
jgi:uncharacterized membrane protein YGL010W